MSRGVYLLSSRPGCPSGPGCRVAGWTDATEKGPDISSFGASRDSPTECGAFAASQPEIEERLLQKQEETQKELSLANKSSDATGTTLEEQTAKNMKRRREAFYLDDEKATAYSSRRTTLSTATACSSKRTTLSSATASSSSKVHP